jgi:mannose-6-phosphate isomerase-like protein (cupin superfamily)
MQRIPCYRETADPLLEAFKMSRAAPIATLVPNNQDRDANPFAFLNGEFHLKVSSADTDGRATVFDTIRHTPGGPPLHLHHDQDEWFLVTEGQFDIRIGESLFHLAPGDSILAPKGVPHSFRNSTQTGRLIVAFLPAGTMEDFFAAGSTGGDMSPQEFAKLFELHGMQVVGPPLQAAPPSETTGVP